jgi:transposase
MTFSLPKVCFLELGRCVYWQTRHTTQMSYATRSRRRGASAVIPSKTSRAQRLPHDEDLYKARSEIECTISLLKQARRFATRYEKTLRNYAAVVALGCALLWLRI